LYFNEKLQILGCSNNQLTSLYLNEKLETIFYNDNPIYEIINSSAIDTIKRKIRVLNQFRYLYYSLKFKKRFRDWLWVKVREPKIREQYSTANLLKLLEKDDLEHVLDTW
jgi:hypothetical protein